MKILVANKQDWKHPRAGGAEVNLKETLTRLVDRGHEVHLITASYPGAEKSEVLDGVNIHRYGLKGRTNEIFILTLGQLIFNYWIRKIEPDVIFTVSSIMTWIPLSQKDKHLVSIHHLNKKSNFGQFSFPFNFLSYIAERLSIFLTRGKEIMTVSPATSQDLMDHGLKEENITEIFNGINYEKYQTGDNADNPKILYLGRLEYNKGVDLIPQIYEEIDNCEEAIEMDIAGRGRKEDQIKEFSNSKANVNFNGYVTEKKKKELLEKAWVVIIPSRREGWGLTVAEANASGTSVVSFDNGGLEYSVKDGENGILVKSNPHPESYIQEFSEKVVELIRNDSKREELEKKAKEHAKKRSWEETVDDLEKLLADISSNN